MLAMGYISIKMYLASAMAYIIIRMCLGLSYFFWNHGYDLCFYWNMFGLNYNLHFYQNTHNLGYGLHFCRNALIPFKTYLAMATFNIFIIMHLAHNKSLMFLLKPKPKFSVHFK